VEAAHFDGTGNLDCTPDRWLDADQRDLQLVDGRRCLLGGHRDIVTVVELMLCDSVESSSPGVRWVHRLVEGAEGVLYFLTVHHKKCFSVVLFRLQKNQLSWISWLIFQSN
jgi:hypothetical protein